MSHSETPFSLLLGRDDICWRYPEPAEGGHLGWHVRGGGGQYYKWYNLHSAELGVRPIFCIRTSATSLHWLGLCSTFLAHWRDEVAIFHVLSSEESGSFYESQKAEFLILFENFSELPFNGCYNGYRAGKKYSSRGKNFSLKCKFSKNVATVIKRNSIILQIFR